MRILYLLLLVATLSGCTSIPVYKEPSPATPTAQIVLKSHDLSSEPLFAAKFNRFSAYADDNCTKAEGFGVMHQFFRLNSGSEKAFLALAGQRIFIRDVAWGYGGPGSSSTPAAPNTIVLPIHSCTNVISFVPEAGHKYLALQTKAQVNQACSTSLVDEESGAPPATFQVNSLNEGCKYDPRHPD
jgi:hypothetical protein